MRLASQLAHWKISATRPSLRILGVQFLMSSSTHLGLNIPSLLQLDVASHWITWFYGIEILKNVSNAYEHCKLHRNFISSYSKSQKSWAVQVTGCEHRKPHAWQTGGWNDERNWEDAHDAADQVHKEAGLKQRCPSGQTKKTQSFGHVNKLTAA